MQVPEKLQLQLWSEIEQFERNLSMPYMTSVERIGIEKGMQLGFLQGRQEGKQEGRQEGRQEEAANLLRRLMTRRFGAIKPEVIKRIEAAPCDQIEYWTENIFDATTIDDVFKNNA
jgi:flagellar biosynthesis/type III secretory pathway protein FliH